MATQAGTMPFDLFSSSDRDSLGTHLHRWLAPLGLTERKPRSWVDGSTPPARRLFELQLMKGAGIKACWGFSLDFVPHISAGRVRWHRSDKAARLDLIVDPMDLNGTHRHESDILEVLPEAVERAQSDWNRGKTFGGMLDLIRQLREHRSNCFGYGMYTQLPLAFAFLSAKVGNKQDAEETLDEYCKRSDLDEEEASKLRRAAWA